MKKENDNWLERSDCHFMSLFCQMLQNDVSCEKVTMSAFLRARFKGEGRDVTAKKYAASKKVSLSV